MDTVYVALSSVLKNGMPVLDLVLDTFQHDKTKLVLTFVNEHEYLQDFMNLAERHYRPRCKEKKFEAEIVTPLPPKPLPSSKETLSPEEHVKSSVLDLIKRCGMKKLVLDAYWRSQISSIFDEMRDLDGDVKVDVSCKIWLVHHDSGRKLMFERMYGPDPDLKKASEEAEDFKKKANEETIKRQSLEQEVLSLTEETKKNKQAIMNIEELLAGEKQEKNNLTLKFEANLKKQKEDHDIHSLNLENLLKREKEERKISTRQSEERLNKAKEEKKNLLFRFYILLSVCGVMSGLLAGVVIALVKFRKLE